MSTEIINKANSIGYDFKNKVSHAEDHLGKMVHDAGVKVGSSLASFSDRASAQLENGRAYVKDNPGKGVAIAAAAGVVVGSLITMAMRRKP